MKRLFVIACLLAAAAGCARPASENRFLLADAKVSAAYIILAHPGAVAQAEAAGDTQRVTDLNALANEMRRNGLHKLAMVQGDVDGLEAMLEAMAALNAAIEAAKGGDAP